MAISKLTKQDFATALKELMKEHDFEQIRVTHICEQSGYSRNKFYYHFKDKYDLLNWIFDTEFGLVNQKYEHVQIMAQGIERMRAICVYFYEHRDFYRNALQYTGQNSFSEHLYETITPLIKKRLFFLFEDEQSMDFELSFFADAVFYTLKRWLMDEQCMPVDEFVDRTLVLMQKNVKILSEKYQANEGRADARIF